MTKYRYNNRVFATSNALTGRKKLQSFCIKIRAKKSILVTQLHNKKKKKKKKKNRPTWHWSDRDQKQNSFVPYFKFCFSHSFYGISMTFFRINLAKESAEWMATAPNAMICLITALSGNRVFFSFLILYCFHRDSTTQYIHKSHRCRSNKKNKMQLVSVIYSEQLARTWRLDFEKDKKIEKSTKTSPPPPMTKISHLDSRNHRLKIVQGKSTKTSFPSHPLRFTDITPRLTKPQTKNCRIFHRRQAWWYAVAFLFQIRRKF